MEHEGGNTILVVNDMPDQLELLNTLLGKAGYRVITAVPARATMTRAGARHHLGC